MSDFTFNFENIIYKGIYEHFASHPKETIHTFANKVYGACGYSAELALYLTCTCQMKVGIIKRICDAIYMPFEKAFELRDSAQHYIVCRQKTDLTFKCSDWIKVDEEKYLTIDAVKKRIESLMKTKGCWEKGLIRYRIFDKDGVIVYTSNYI